MLLNPLTLMPRTGCVDAYRPSSVVTGSRAFQEPTKDRLVTLGSMEEADDYTYRVAGSVGEFWTEVSLAHPFDSRRQVSRTC